MPGGWRALVTLTEGREGLAMVGCRASQTVEAVAPQLLAE